MDSTKEPPTLLSFCTGYGGIERGIERVVGPVRTIANVEIEAFAVANLVDKMETGQLVPCPVWTNLKTFPAHIFRGCVDILTAGYPCQPFSAAGKRNGADDPRHLWPFIREHIRTIKPAVCFFENVEGHISLGLSTVLSDLEEDGYSTTWGIFSAAEVGAPHQRKRVFILARNKLADTRYLPGCAEQREQQKEHTKEFQGGSELADGNSIRREARLPKPEQREKRNAKKFNHSRHRWPARPGEEQYEWEDPRVI